MLRALMNILTTMIQLTSTEMAILRAGTQKLVSHDPSKSIIC
jgi:hypothetical protein